jgi:hypothetical protein
MSDDGDGKRPRNEIIISDKSAQEEERCGHYDCRCSFAAELAVQGRTVEAIRLHIEKPLIRCRRPAATVLKLVGLVLMLTACGSGPDTQSDGGFHPLVVDGGSSDVDPPSDAGSDATTMPDADVDDAPTDAGSDTSNGPRRVFVTDENYASTFGSLAAADSDCNAAAATAGLGGTWVAWLSSSTTSMTSRLGMYGGPFVRLDGTAVATDASQLFSSTLLAPIDLSESMTTVNKYVWTGTALNGRTSGMSCIVQGMYLVCTCGDAGSCLTCDDWTNAASTTAGTLGISDQTVVAWTTNDDGSGGQSCSLLAGLYCFER